MTITKQKIQKEIKAAGLHQWQIAASLGIAESTLTRRLRQPLAEAEVQKIRQAIQKLQGVS